MPDGIRLMGDSAGAPTPVTARTLIYRNTSTGYLEGISGTGSGLYFAGRGIFDDVVVTSSAGARTLDAGDVKSLQVYTDNGNSIWTLPAASAFPEGGVVALKNEGSGVLTPARAGSDSINGAMTYPNGITQGVTVIFVSNGTDGWRTIDCSAGSGGGASFPKNAQNGNYTLVAGDAGQRVVKESGNAALFTLPAANTYSDGDQIIIHNADASDYLRLAPPAGASLDPSMGADIQALLMPGDKLTVTTDGTTYYLLQKPRVFVLTRAKIVAAGAVTGADFTLWGSADFMTGVVITREGAAPTNPTTVVCAIGDSGASYNDIANVILTTTALSTTTVTDLKTQLVCRITTSGGNLSDIDNFDYLEFLVK